VQYIAPANDPCGFLVLPCDFTGTLLQVKGLSREELALRPDQVKALAARIDAVPDGVTLNNRRAQRGGPGSHREIKIDAVNPGTIQLPSAVWLVLLLGPVTIQFLPF
jgi:hypothetical protein